MKRNKTFKLLSAVSLALALLLVVAPGYPVQPQSLRVLIAAPSPLTSMAVEQGFYRNLPDDLLEDIQFISLEASTVFVAASAIRAEQPDLIVMAKAFTFDPMFPAFFFEATPPLLRNLTDQRLKLIDAGLLAVAVEGWTIGAELPWDPNFVIVIAEGTARFEKALGFLTALAQNILNFQIEGYPISVKAHNLSNDTGEKVYGVHLVYDKPPADADAEDNRDWKCHVKGNKAICTTRIGLAPGKRLAIGVAFRAEEPGNLTGCWWVNEHGAKVDGC